MTTTTMTPATPVAPARLHRDVGAWLVTTTALAAMSAVFAIAHLQHWRRTGDPKGVAVAIEEIIVVVLAISRRRPVASSTRTTDWIAAFAGSYGALLLRPAGDALFGLEWCWTALQILGAVCAIAALLRLRRSFGVVAANRGVTRSGMYRVVRHPLYASYLVAMTGYVLAAPTARNVIVVAAVTVAQLWRISAEERVLDADDDYRAYKATVRYRLVPGLF